MALWTRYGADRARTFFAVAQAGIVFDGSRDDLVYGGSGGDDLTAANDPGGDDLYSSGGGPIDIIAYSFRTGGGITVDLPLGRASGGGAGNDRLVGPWDDVHDSIFADILTGNAGANTRRLGGRRSHRRPRGNDFLFGEEGTDLLDGGDGTDACNDGETLLNCEP